MNGEERAAIRSQTVGTLTATGVTVFMTAEVSEAFPDARFTSERVSFIIDEIILQRSVEIERELPTILAP